jgi:transcription elongation GreA/GreB family factor
MDKRACIAALRARLSEEIEAATRAAKDAAAAATHEENKPENDKDMRSTEASYVAKGQADRVRALEHALAMLEAMAVRDFAKGEAIAASALVDVTGNGHTTTYLVVPAAGGVRAKVDGHEVQTLATSSPLGAALIGLSEGDEAEVETPQGLRTWTIASVR